MKRLMILILLVLATAGMAYADEGEGEGEGEGGTASEKVRVEEVVITAGKIEEPEKETTSSVRVIKEADIKKLNAVFVTDVLRQASELSVVQTGGEGTVAVVYIRGGGAEHTLVMIDGVKVKSTTTGQFDFAGISVDDIERIEIVKGPQSTIYGSEAIGGVVNIITKKGVGKAKHEVSFEGGSYGSYKPSLSVSGASGRLDYRLTTSYFKTEGISAYRQGTEKDGYINESVSGKFGLKLRDDAEVEFSGRYFHDRTDLDSVNADDTNYTQSGNHYILSGKGSLFLSDKWEQSLTLSTVRDYLKYRDPDTSWNNSDVSTGMDTADWQHNFFLSDAYTLTAGAEYREERGVNQDVFDRVIDNKAVYLNNKIAVFSKGNAPIVLNAGLRNDRHETSGEETTYKLGAVCEIKPAGVRLRSSYGTGFRAPTLNELFYRDNWGSTGNPSLRPERSAAWEAGVEKDIFSDRASVSLTYFNQDYTDLIQWSEVAPWTWQPQNISTARIRGIETGAGISVTKALSLKAGYTYLDTKNKATGKRLIRRPKDRFNLSALLSNKKYSLSAGYAFTGERDDSRQKLASYGVINLSGSYNVTKTISLFARAENLLDEDYEEAAGYGTKGASYYGGIKVSF